MFRHLTFRLLPHYSSLMQQRNLPKVLMFFRYCFLPKLVVNAIGILNVRLRCQLTMCDRAE